MENKFFLTKILFLIGRVVSIDLSYIEFLANVIITNSHLNFTKSKAA